MTAIILAAFFLSPAASDGLSPVELTGDMRADWTNHAETAEACVVDEMPTPNILNQWKHLGVRVLKRVAFDPECSAEYFRRKAGFLAVRDRVDGVWLVGEEKFPETWKLSLAEAKIDVAVALYCKSLAEEALGWQEKDHRVWIEGRRVMWLLEFMDFDSENLDTLRLEFICYAKRLEQLLGKPERKLPLAVSKPIAPDRPAFEPLAGRDVQRVQVSVGTKGTAELGEGFAFNFSGKGFDFTISSKSGAAKDVWPGGRGSFRLYLPDGKGSYLPYEFRIDLSPIDENRAPTDAYGLWFLEERWGRGKLSLYSAPRTWRLVPVARGSYGSKYPRLKPKFDFKWGEKGGWTLKLEFSWLSIYGFWPSVRNGIAERWYVALDAFPGVPAAACRLDWARGREANFKLLASGISCREITDRYAEQKMQAEGVYRLWHEDRLYGYAKTAKPTYQRCDAESDRVFWERVVEPMVETNKNAADITYVHLGKDGAYTTAKLMKEGDAVKMAVWKALGKLFDLAERVSLARRDYILMRYDGKMPPEPQKRKGGGGAADAPNADSDDNALQLDDKEF